MKYRKTGIVVAGTFWFTCVLQLLVLLNSSLIFIDDTARLVLDVLAILLGIATYCLQAGGYRKAGIDPHMELHAGHWITVFGVFMKLLAGVMSYDHCFALILNIIALLLLLSAMLIMLRANKYEPS